MLVNESKWEYLRVSDAWSKCLADSLQMNETTACEKVRALLSIATRASNAKGEVPRVKITKQLVNMQLCFLTM